MPYDYTLRLHEALSAVCPIDGCTLDDFMPSASATLQQITNAQSVLASFVRSDAAHETWLANRIPERKELLDAAQQAVADNNTFLAIGTPSNAQVLAQVRALTQQNNRLIRRLVQI
jgi:hypothetical protein